MINMEQIRSMTPDQLSAFLYKIAVTGTVFCKGYCEGSRMNKSCRACITMWLMEEGDKKL